MRPEMRQSTLNMLSTTLTTMDSLATFLTDFSLRPPGLRPQASMDGNCWWSTNM